MSCDRSPPRSAFGKRRTTPRQCRLSARWSSKRAAQSAPAMATPVRLPGRVYDHDSNGCVDRGTALTTGRRVAGWWGRERTKGAPTVNGDSDDTGNRYVRRRMFGRPDGGEPTWHRALLSAFIWAFFGELEAPCVDAQSMEARARIEPARAAPASWVHRQTPNHHSVSNIYARYCVKNPRLRGTHGDTGSLVALEDELVGVCSCEHLGERLPPTGAKLFPASTKKIAPQDGAILVVGSAQV